MPMRKEEATQPIYEQVDAIYRSESRRIFATLIRLLGDFDLAEEAVQTAFAAALEQWPQEGVPANPRAWLVSTGRFKAIDALRRSARLNSSIMESMGQLEASFNRIPPNPTETDQPEIAPEIEDDRLRLIFTCCHPALPPDAQVALTLREVCGLTTEEIARAFLTSAPTIAQRVVRAKAKIRDARIPYEVPARAALPNRLDVVLRVVYLVFNEGYTTSYGTTLTRHDLSSEAIRLARLFLELLPDPEAEGLLALMLLHESRRSARTTPDGEMILLEDQDRSLWNRELISEGTTLVRHAFASRRLGPYTLQAAISALHAEAPSSAATDWSEIVALYDLLLRIDPSPVVELNRAVAIAMRDGPAAGLSQIEGLLANGELDNYPLAHSAKAELCRRTGQMDEAKASFEKALALTSQEQQRRFLRKRLAEIK